MKIITDNLESNAPVYHKYSCQFQPQSAYIELDCRGEGELIADWNGEIGNAVPMYLWNGLVVRWGISPETSKDSIESLFENEEFLQLLHTILDGFEEVWDGNNWVGRYTDAASEAIEDVERLLANELESCEVWDVNDWLFSNCRLTEHWSDQPLQEAVEEVGGWEDNNQVIHGDIEEALINKAKEEFEYHPDRLNKNHVDELLNRKEISQSDYDEWLEEYGDSIEILSEGSHGELKSKCFQNGDV